MIGLRERGLRPARETDLSFRGMRGFQRDASAVRVVLQESDLTAGRWINQR